ncbi:Protein of unknown function [Lactobacillus helveticus CIRM-BIA 104]|uniref:Uncharacterized protein n=1 Tax=Lactobacillus helveticus CIRM-BIA 104 TaxID=1226333 RepID=U6F7M4_LACHE|nr:Protein of unknown function [Lactobacillus helveticus CIRM-BIA 104]
MNKGNKDDAGYQEEV